MVGSRAVAANCMILEQLEALGADVGPEDGVPSDVAAGPRETRDEASFNRIADAHHDDGDCCCRVLGRLGRGRPIRHNDVDASLDEVLRERGQPLGPTFGPAIFEVDRSPFDIAELAQPLKHRIPKFLVVEQTDPRHLYRFLCLGGDRRGERTGHRGQQEAAAVHAGMVGRVTVEGQAG
jgi:hypothetical protein